MKKGKPSSSCQNKMFKEDTKKFYISLSMQNIEAGEPPSMTETETYWMSLWGEEAQRNEEQNG